MKWYEILAMVCSVFNAAVLLVGAWVFSDVLKSVVAIRSQAEKGQPAPPPPPPMLRGLVEREGRLVAIPPMPRWMDPASEKGLEFLAYEEILKEPARFSEEDAKEAENYFDRLPDQLTG